MSNSAPIRSMAILKPQPGKEQEMLSFFRDFYTMMRDKNYSNDILFRDTKDATTFVHIRTWRSVEARETATQDPDVHRYWLKMPEICTIPTIYENLEVVFDGAKEAEAAV